jgi:hypothetical protein
MHDHGVDQIPEGNEGFDGARVGLKRRDQLFDFGPVDVAKARVGEWQDIVTATIADQAMVCADTEVLVEVNARITEASAPNAVKSILSDLDAKPVTVSNWAALESATTIGSMGDKSRDLGRRRQRPQFGGRSWGHLGGTARGGPRRSATSRFTSGSPPLSIVEGEQY